MIRYAFILVLTLMMFGFVGTAVSQIPDEFINLHVLPKDIAKDKLVDTMKSFTRALGVRCEFCHVGEAGAPLSKFDFPADTKEQKKTARVMLNMVRDINANYIAKLGKPEADRISVRCATCHHGLSRPKLLEDVLMEAFTDKGVDGAVKLYHDLKDRYYGSYSYDFSERSLNQLAMQLLSQKKPQPAISFLQLNIEENPKSVVAFMNLSQAYEQSGDKQKAIEALEKVLTLDPGNDEIKKRIEEMKNPKKK